MIEIDLKQTRYYIFSGLAITAHNAHVGHGYAILRNRENKEMFEVSEDIKIINDFLIKENLQNIRQENGYGATFWHGVIFDEKNREGLNSLCREYRASSINFPTIGDTNNSAGLRKLNDYKVIENESINEN